MNTIKKTVLFLVFILMQNKISAQAENNASAEDVAIKIATPVNINSDVNHKSFTSISAVITTSIQTLLPSNSIKNNVAPNNSSNLNLILPQVIDPKLMDTKPE